MSCRHKVHFITILPSPYQRDMFGALAARTDIELTVQYLELEAPDSPWPQVPLRTFEYHVPGFWFPFAGGRWHVNWNLLDIKDADFVVLSTYTSLTGQYLMRSKLRGKKWLFWAERLRAQPGFKDNIQRMLLAPLADASAIVGIGRAAEIDYHARFPQLPHYCIPYHCELAAFLAAPRSPPGARLRFLFCGQMIRRKGVDLLLLAFDSLVRKGYDIELLLVGREAELPEFLAQIDTSSSSRIIYEGFKAPEELPDMFARADVFVMPSRHDGWGVVVNQALAAGLPVITSDAVGAGLDLVEDRVNGMTIAAGDAQQLEQAMQTMADDRDLVSNWGRASRARALTLTPEAGAEKWARVFDDLHEQQRSQA